MSTHETLALAGGILISALTILAQVAFWQRKEYRFDRMRAHVVSPEGSLRYQYALLTGVVAIALAWVIYFFTGNTKVECGACIALLAFAIHHELRIRAIGLLRPVWTAKSAALALGTIAIAYAYSRYLFSSVEVPILQIATAVFILPLITALLIPPLNLIFYIRKRQTSQQALRYRQQLQSLQVVGITGSVGKTSTKYFLNHILSGSTMRVASTPNHCNSYYCIAKDVLAKVTTNTQVYIAEMGAYRRGEIKEIADIVQPTIGILTAISNQHLHLFGSQDAIAQTKWELAQSLPTNGTLVMNGDDPILEERSQTHTGKIMRFSLQQPADVWFEHITLHPTRINATLHILNEAHPIEIPLASPASLYAIAAAVSGAVAVGVPPDVIVKQVQTVTAFARTMEVRGGKNGSVVIDDSYSAGELAVQNAIEHLERFLEKDKRIVMVPMIELGAAATAAHERLGELLAKSSASIYIFGEAYKKEIKQFAGKATIQWFTDPRTLTKAAVQGVGKDTAILLKGRIPKSTRQAILSPS